MDPSTTPVRKTIAIPADIYARTVDFRFDRRINSESEALCRLIEAGLRYELDAAQPKGSAQ